ncbi:MAG: hypothetical protein ABUL68_00880 [Pseudomonadota bacterium]
MSIRTQPPAFLHGKRFVYVAFCLLWLGSWLTATAGSFESKLGSDDKATAGKAKLDIMSRGSGSENGTGPVPYLRALGAPPKRVALVSFYVWDAGNVKQSVYNTAMTWRFSKSVTATGIERIATGLYDAGIGAMKEGFAAYGMQLLTPDEFLDTADKKAAYLTFKPEHGALGSVMGFLQSKDRSLSYAAEGFSLLELPANTGGKNRDFRMAAQGGDGKLFQGLGHDLAGALGVDAVLVVYNVLQAESKSIQIINASAYLFGPNPVKRDNASLYWTGHQYAGVHLPLDVSLMKVDRKGVEVENDFAGYAHVARALALKTGDYLKERMGGKK